MRESLAHADLVLPGDKAILTRHHVDVLETGGMAVDYHAELELLSLANETNRTIYLVLRSEKEAKMVYRFFSEYIDRDQDVYKRQDTWYYESELQYPFVTSEVEFKKGSLRHPTYLD